MAMRIAYAITRADDLGGSQIHVRDIAAAMQRRGHRVAVFAGRPGALSDQLRDQAVPYIEIAALARDLDPLQDARGLSELRAAFRDFGPDLVSAHCAKAGVLARLAARSLGVPALFTAHGWSFSEGVPSQRRSLYGWMERSVAPLSQRVIVVCDADRRTALQERVASPRKLRLVYNGVSDVEPALRAHPESIPARLITVARLSEQKDHVTLLGALAQIRDLSWHLDYVGDGPLRNEVHALAKEQLLSDRVSFLGMRTDVASLLARSHTFLLVSNWEGFPRSILEAMRARLPVIASDTGGVRESVLDGTTGFVVAPSDARALADRLRRLIASPSLRARMGRAGRARYEQRFTLERMVDETYDVYQEVIGGHRRRSAPMFLSDFAAGTGTHGPTLAIPSTPPRPAVPAKQAVRPPRPKAARPAKTSSPRDPAGPAPASRGRHAARPAQNRAHARLTDPTAGGRPARIVEMRLDEGGQGALPVRWLPWPGGVPFDRPSPGPLQEAPKDEITLRGLLDVAARRWRLISAVLLVAILGMAFVTFRILTPLYESTAVVLIKPGREFVSGGLGDRGLVQSRMDGIIMAELEILHSEDLLREAVTAFGPARLYPDPEITGASDPLAAAVREYRVHLSATAVPGSQVIRITFRHPDPETAAASVNLLVDRFTAHHLKAFSESQSRGFLEGKVAEDRTALEDKEERLRKFQEENPIVTAGSPGQELEEQRARLDLALKQVRNDVTGLDQRLVYLRQHEASLSRTSGLREDIERQIVGAEAELPALRARQKGLENQLASVEGRLQGLATLLKTYRDLVRERDAAERRHQTHSERLEQALVSEEMDRAKIANISVIQRGQAAQSPITPRKALNLAVGALLGIGLGFGSALLLEGLRAKEPATR